MARQVVGDAKTFKVVFADGQSQVELANGCVVEEAMARAVVVIEYKRLTIWVRSASGDTFVHDSWVRRVRVEDTQKAADGLEVGYSFKGKLEVGTTFHLVQVVV